MKDLIEITDKTGKKRQVELVATFNLENYEYNYIIYRELDRSHNFVARYMGEDIAYLDSNLSQEELELSKIVFEGVKE